MPKEQLLNLAERENMTQIFIYLDHIFYEGNSYEVYTTIYDFWETKVSTYLWEYGLYSDYLECGKIVLKCARKMNDVKIISQLLGEVGYAYMERGDYDLAEGYFLESFEIYTELHEDTHLCRTMRYLAIINFRLNRISDAKDYIFKGLELIKQQDISSLQENYIWELGRSEFYGLLGSVELKLGNYSIAHSNFAIAFRLAKNLSKNSEYYQLAHLRNLGESFQLRKKYTCAIFIYRFCLSKSKLINRLDLVIGVSLDLAELLFDRGDFFSAKELVQEAIDLCGNDHPLMLERAVDLINYSYSLAVV